MRSILLGTGASEGIPAAYCECTVCKNARLNRGKNVRTRNCFYIDEGNMIDYGPDLFMQCVTNGLTLRNMKNVFLTHFHEDHINASAFSERPSGNPAAEGKLCLYGSAAALRMVKKAFGLYKEHTRIRRHNYFKNIKLMTLKPFKTYVANGLEVTPVISSHPGYGFFEWGYNYIIKTADSMFLYAVDTGWYGEKTWKYLEKHNNTKFDFVVMECTYGNYEMPDYMPEHLDLKNVFLMLDKMDELGLTDKTTPIYLTHICHLHSLDVEKTQEILNKSGRKIVWGYDGLIIEH